MRYMFLTLPTGVLSVFFFVTGLGYWVDLSVPRGFASMHPEGVLALGIACVGSMLFTLQISDMRMAKLRRHVGMFLFIVGSCVFIIVLIYARTESFSSKVSARINVRAT